MLSFRSILLAAAAFATVASAIPTPAGPLDGVPGVSGITGGGGPLAVADSVTGAIGGLGGLGGALGGAGSVVPAGLRRGEHHSPKEVFEKCHDGMAGLVVELSRYHFSIYLVL